MPQTENLYSRKLLASISDLFLFALIFQSLAFYKSTTVILINTKFPEETAALFTKDLDG